jgi:hypothetical protein
MKVIEALYERLQEQGDMSLRRVNLRFSPKAAWELVRELEGGGIFSIERKMQGCIAQEMAGREDYEVWHTKPLDHAFDFSLDRHLPGTSFVMRLKKK